ncbi:MAG: glycosyltransferase family 4 protein [Candidatus Woesearchaeota archaeon]|nr:glycosyltransferase family 4 protein [Candidatus Woesearchaeota archaeon]
MTERKKLLLFTEYFPVSEHAEFTGGVESRFFYIVKELSRTQDITVICSHQPEQKRDSIVCGARIIRVGPSTPYSNKGFVVRRSLTALYMLFKGIKQKADIVEGASFMTYVPAFLTAVFLRAQARATWHETWLGEWIKHKGIFTGFFGEIWERIALRFHWDMIISISEFTKQRLLKYGTRCQNIHVLANGIDYDLLSKLAVKKHELPTIMTFGRLSQQKDIQTLIHAIKILSKDISKVQCDIIGDGPARTELEQLTKKLGLQDRIHFLGKKIKYLDHITAAKKCHVYCSPSLLEGFGITLIEAMALGLPYAVTRIPPFVEVTNNGKGGFLFKPQQPAELAQQLKILLTNKKIYSSKIKEAQTLAKTYSWTRLIKQSKFLM